jgi:hypothetical protein
MICIMKYFRPNIKRFGLGFAIIGIALAVHAFLPPIKLTVVLLRFFGLGLLGLACYLLIYHSYFLVEDDILSTRIGYFNKYKYDIKKIVSIYRRSMFGGRGIFFQYRDENRDAKEKEVIINDALYDHKTIDALVSELKRINPQIKLDKTFIEWVEKHK